MPITTPIRLFLLAALVTILGLAFAAWTAGAVLPVLIGVAGACAAAVAFVAEVDRSARALPGTSRRSASTDHAAPRVL